MIHPPKLLRGVEYKTRLEGGLSRPLLIVAQDQNSEKFKVVLKTRRPDPCSSTFGPTSLSCELICSVLARAFGLPVPDYYIVSIDPAFCSLIVERDVRELLERNCGDNFGCLYHQGYLTHPLISKVEFVKIRT